MKKNKKNIQASNCDKRNNVTNRNNNNVTDNHKNDMGFKSESKSFQLDEDSSKSFDLE